MLPGGPETKITLSTPALTTLATSTPTCAAAGSPRLFAVMMISASNHTPSKTLQSGRVTITPADLSLIAWKTATSNSEAENRAAKRDSVVYATVTAPATCLGPSMTSKSGSLLMLWFAARTECPDLSAPRFAKAKPKKPKLQDSSLPLLKNLKSQKK